MPQTFAPYRFIELLRGSSEKQNQKLYFHVASDCQSYSDPPKEETCGEKTNSMGFTGAPMSQESPPTCYHYSVTLGCMCMCNWY